MTDSIEVDLRSDTVTRPGPKMRRAMAEAEVGDDVHGEDPTVRRLEQVAAGITGHEAALFVPSGTMGNQIAIHLHVRPGEDVLVEQHCHVVLYELGAMCAWSGATPRVLVGRDGVLTVQQVSEAVDSGDEFMARSAALVLENTHNHAGGVLLDPQTQQELIECARERGLRVHLDGARVFHAACSSGCSVAELTRGFDTVMFCLSKGLGAPVGSMLCANEKTIAAARLVRKRMGGGMRQAGILAAAGLYALEHNVERLADDHRRARHLAQALSELAPFEIDPRTVRTNIVIARLNDPSTTREQLARMKSHGLLAESMGSGRIRFVTHLDVDDAAIDRAIQVLRHVAEA